MTYPTPDLLGSLPDDILIHILSLLPINYAAVTSVLSRRWRSLWTRVTRLKLDNLYLSSLHDIFKQRTSSKLDYFYLVALHPCDDTLDHDSYCLNSLFDPLSNDDFCYLNSLLDQISRQQVSKIKIKLQPKARYLVFLRVPTGVFNNRHLVKLKLEGKLVIDNSSVSSVNLPNLKKVSFWVDSTPYELLEKILKFCPKLRKLSVFGEITHSTRSLHLSSETLEYLNIGPDDREYVIDTPNLKHLVLYPDDTDNYRFVSKPKTVVKAEIFFTMPYFFDRNDHYSQAHEIVQWISGVSSVWVDAGMVKALRLLYDHTISFFNNLTVLNIDYDDLGVVKGLKQLYDDDKLPFFNNLVVLKILFHGPKRCWNDVLLLVRVSPNLQYLKVNEFASKTVEPDWVEPDLDDIHTAILTRLKTIKLKNLRGTSKDIAMISYVLNNVETLKLLIVGCSIEGTNNEAVKLSQENKFRQEIALLPKRSDCEIQFNRRVSLFVE